MEVGVRDERAELEDVAGAGVGFFDAGVLGGVRRSADNGELGRRGVIIGKVGSKEGRTSSG